MSDSAVERRNSLPERPALTPEQLALKRQFPTAQDLRERARRRLPNFAFEYADGGAGADTGIRRNWNALDAVEMVPRYGRVITPPPADTTLFGKTYAAPIGIAPVGGPGTRIQGRKHILPGQRRQRTCPIRWGCCPALISNAQPRSRRMSLWLQLYRFSRNDHKIGLDLVRRAQDAGVNVLVLTIDTPTRTTRPREVKSGIMSPFKLTMRLRMDAVRSPHWMRSLRRNGTPRFTSLAPYMEPGMSIAESAAFIRRESGGAFTWDEIGLYRDKWKGPLVLKGIMHPDDAERAVELGLDGLFVTNHGGRQIDALPAPIDVLPAIADRVGDRTTLIYDSGVRSGVDAARAVALGADAAFAGKSFLWSLGALGEKGPAHLIDIYIDDISATLGQLGCRNVDELRDIAVRHPGAYSAADFSPSE